MRTRRFSTAIAIATLTAGSASSAPQGSWSFSDEPELLSPDAIASDRFGEAMDIEGDLLLVGSAGRSPTLSGAYGGGYVYRRSGDAWVLEATLVSPSSDPSEMLGGAACLDAGRAVLGGSAPLTGFTDGAVSIFEDVGGVWTETQRIPAPDLNPGGDDGFGVNVALRADTLAVGATPRYFCPFNGFAVVYREIGGSFELEAIIEPPSPFLRENFGETVVLGDDILFVGAPKRETATGTGAVAVFTRTGTTWSFAATLTAPAAAGAIDAFGQAAALDGDTLLIGGSQPGGPGLVFAYRGSGASWTFEATLSHSAAGASDSFGSAIELEGDRALIDLSRLSGANMASAVLFTRFGTTWTERATIAPPTSNASAPFNGSLAMSGSLVVVGEQQGGFSPSIVRPYDLTPTAGSLVRNVGANPLSYTVSAEPRLGGSFSAQIDLAATTGHAQALLIGFAAPTNLPLAGGQGLLVDVTHASGELLSLPVASGPVASYSLSIPNDPALSGFQLATQAIHLGALTPFALSNAQDLLLGL